MDVIALEGVSKYYSSTDTLALDEVSFGAARGEIHALLGSNGAGKSTLVRVSCGIVRPDEGRLSVKGRQVHFASYRDASRAGIGLVPQLPTLAEGLSVAENIAFGHEPRKAGVFFDRKRAIYEAAMLASGNGFSIPVDIPVAAMARAERREAEILRAFSSGGEILFLDEPGNALSDEELSRLFALLGRLRDSGVCIVYVSHRLREVCAIADRVSVLQRGRRKTLLARGEFDEASLAEILSPYPRGARGATPTPRRAGSGGERDAALPVAFRAVGVHTRLRHGEGLAGIDFSVGSSEILGIFAFGGNGLEAFEEIVTGQRRPNEGHLYIAGRDLSTIPPRTLYGKMLGYIAGDRDGKSLCLEASVRENAVARVVGGDGNPGPDGEAERILERLSYSGNGNAQASSLSGGNRQRLVCARELAPGCSLVVASDPLQGLDPESARGIRDEIRARADEGAAVLYLSGGLDEIVEIADRILVLYRGRLFAADPGRLAGEGGSYVTGLAMGSLPP